MTEKTNKFIPELEGLRGILALWVFISHALRTCDYYYVSLLSEGNLAVQVFVILSGFMIGRLRLFNPEPYSAYILRRLARIYPAYLLALILGIAVSNLLWSTYETLPWITEDLKSVIIRHSMEQKNFFSLLLGHITMLHGIFPEEILEGSSFAFVGPAWSLSLEWQFYLVAPAFIALLMSRRYQGITLLCVFLASITVPHLLAHFTYIIPSFLPLMLSYFTVGIMSAFLFDKLRNVNSEYLLYGIGAVVCALLSSAALWKHAAIPFIIWAVAILASLRLPIWGIRMVSLVLTSRPIEQLGKVSYAFYLFHTAVYMCIASALIALGVQERISLLVGIIVIGIPITLILSMASYNWIERPIMRYVKRVEKREKRTSSPKTA